MIRFFVVILSLLIAAIAGLAFLPLGTALKYSGISASGAEWSRAVGSVLSGRLEGLKYKGTTYGDADLELDANALLSRKLQYAVAWTGNHGIGNGKVSFERGPAISLKDYSITLDLLEYEKTARWLQQSGGKVKLEGPSIRFAGNQCAEAVGVATSDVLDLNRDVLGSGWSELRGDISCDDGNLLIPLQSENAAGTRFAALLRVAPGSAGKFEVRISGRISRALGFALPLAGFTKSGDEFVFVPKARVTASAAP